jgi:hypothetical protein
VGVNDVMPQILWTWYFLEAQGCGVRDLIINQDNQSAILLEKDGRASSGKRAHHISIRYFFVADRIASSEVSVQFCPTGEMNADFFTKPLHGILFRKFRDFIMNIAPTTNSLSDQRSVLRNETNSVTKHGLHSREPQNIGKSRSTRKVAEGHYNSKIWYTDDNTTLVRQWTIHCCFNSTEGVLQTCSFNSHFVLIDDILVDNCQYEQPSKVFSSLMTLLHLSPVQIEVKSENDASSSGGWCGHSGEQAERREAIYSV